MTSNDLAEFCADGPLGLTNIAASQYLIRGRYEWFGSLLKAAEQRCIECIVSHEIST
jgi:hypothetical protein